jgi:hypothetical protein
LGGLANPIFLIPEQRGNDPQRFQFFLYFHEFKLLLHEHLLFCALPQERLSDELLEQARCTGTEVCPSAQTTNPSTSGRRSPSPEQSIGPRSGTPESLSKGTNLSGRREIADASTKRGALSEAGIILSTSPLRATTVTFSPQFRLPIWRFPHLP